MIENKVISQIKYVLWKVHFLPLTFANLVAVLAHASIPQYVECDVIYRLP